MSAKIKREIERIIQEYIEGKKNDEETYLEIHNMSYPRNFHLINIFKELFALTTKYSLEQLQKFHLILKRFLFYPDVLNDIIQSEKDIKTYEKILVTLFQIGYIDVPFIRISFGKYMKQLDHYEYFFQTLMDDQSITPLAKIDLYSYFYSLSKKMFSESIVKSYLIAINNALIDETTQDHVVEIIRHTGEVFMKSPEGKQFLQSNKHIHRAIIDELLLSLSSANTQDAIELIEKRYSPLIDYYERSGRKEIFITFYKNIIVQQMTSFAVSDIVSILENKEKEKFSKEMNTHPFLVAESLLEISRTHEKLIPTVTEFVKTIPSLIKSYMIHRLQYIFEEKKTLNQHEIDIVFRLSPFADIHFFSDAVEFILQLLKSGQYIIGIRIIKSLLCSMNDFNKNPFTDKLNYNAVTPSNLAFVNNIKQADWTDFSNSKKAFSNALKNNKCIFYLLYFLSEMKGQYQYEIFKDETNYNEINTIINVYLHFLDSTLHFNSTKSYIDQNESERMSILHIKENAIFWKAMKFVLPNYQGYEQWRSCSVYSTIKQTIPKTIPIDANDPFIVEINKRESNVFKQVFWLLELDDIYKPIQLYEQNKEKIENSKEDKRSRSEVLKDIDHHSDRLVQLGASLKALKNPNKDEFYRPSSFVFKCFVPRMKQSPKDALYCAQFILEVLDKEIEGFSILFLWEDIASYVLGSTMTMSIEEIKNVGIFVRLLLKKLNSWMNEDVYKKEVMRKRGFLNPKEVPHENFVFVRNKWRGLIEKELIIMLTSKNTSDLYRGIILFNYLVEEFADSLVLKSIIGYLFYQKIHEGTEKVHNALSKKTFEAVKNTMFYMTNGFKANIGSFKMNKHNPNDIMTGVEKRMNEMKSKKLETMKELRQTKSQAIKARLEQLAQDKENMKKKMEMVDQKETQTTQTLLSEYKEFNENRIKMKRNNADFRNRRDRSLSPKRDIKK